MRLIDDDFSGMPPNPHIVEGLLYGMSMALSQDGAQEADETAVSKIYIYLFGLSIDKIGAG